MAFSNLADMLLVFDTEDKCIEHLARLRWPDGVKCPRCNHEKVNYLATRRVWWCGGCKKQFSVRFKTIFEESRIPLQKWFMAIWLHTSHKKGISSCQLARDIGVTQKSAWFMLGRIRKVMTHLSQSNPMTGVVEIDDTYVGGKERNKHNDKRTGGTQGRGSQKTKDVVFGMKQREGDVRAFKVQNLQGNTVKVLVSQHIDHDAEIFADEYIGYRSIADSTINHSTGEYVRGNVHTNSIENAWSLFKRGVIGIYHHISSKHLQRYLDEFMARANTRNLKDHHRVNIFLSRVINLRLTYEQLTR